MFWWLISGIFFVMTLGFFAGVGVYLLFFDKSESEPV